MQVTVTATGGPLKASISPVEDTTIPAISAIIPDGGQDVIYSLALFFSNAVSLSTLFVVVVAGSDDHITVYGSVHDPPGVTVADGYDCKLCCLDWFVSVSTKFSCCQYLTGLLGHTLDPPPTHADVCNSSCKVARVSLCVCVFGLCIGYST